MFSCHGEVSKKTRSRVEIASVQSLRKVPTLFVRPGAWLLAVTQCGARQANRQGMAAVLCLWEWSDVHCVADRRPRFLVRAS